MMYFSPLDYCLSFSFLSLSLQINYRKDKPIFCGRKGKQTSIIKTREKKAFVSGGKKNLVSLEMRRKVAEYSTV